LLPTRHSRSLTFPPGEDFDFTRLRRPRNVTTEFNRKAAVLGFPVSIHDLRGSHATMLLDAGEKPHVVAARLGHDPAVLMRNYAKRTEKADTDVAATIGALLEGPFTIVRRNRPAI
jgi:integrase